MKVKTDYSQCGYITAGKVYSVERDSDGDHAIIDDVGERIWIGIGEGGCHHLRGNDWIVVSDGKPFDITHHEFGDTVGFVDLDGDELTINCTGLNYIELYKDDAIAIAKALGVTAEDLK